MQSLERFPAAVPKRPNHGPHSNCNTESVPGYHEAAADEESSDLLCILQQAQSQIPRGQEEEIGD